ncbi:MAG: exodeoxyribonuclease V subunit beta [Gammaproteobacteria bacterium]|nr:exodeoxyribonuclease V subunit beta [Gammaproteobacteria bacterium]
MNRLDPLTIPLTGVNLIEASAGTGKTYTIASLYLRLLIDSLNDDKVLSVRDILVVTYTNAATQELRERIRARIREALQYVKHGTPENPDTLLVELLQLVDDQRQLRLHLENELTCIDEAAIYTIHGFCQRMLVENAFESGALFENEFIQNEDLLLDEIIRDYWRTHFYEVNSGLALQIRSRWSSPAALKAEIRPHLNKPELLILPNISKQEINEQLFTNQLNEIKAIWSRDKQEIESLLMEDKNISRTKGQYKKEDLAQHIAELDEYLHSTPMPFVLPYGFELFTQSILDSKVTTAKQKKGLLAPQHPFFDACEQLQKLVNGLLLHTIIDAIHWCQQQLQLRKQNQALLSYDDLLTHLRSALYSDTGELLAAHIRSQFPFAMIDEFQDTDPLQYQIFSSIYKSEYECGFYMIGDPKQAIYSFRGADIFTYMKAKQATDNNNQFTLDTNWRSSSNLIAALNSLFGHNPAPFIYAGKIDYHAVNASPLADKKALLINNKQPCALNIWHSEGTEDKKGKLVAWGKEKAREHFAHICANEVANLIRQGKDGEAMIGSRGLQSSDIAILVRDRFEAQTIRIALSRKNIASAYYTRDSVFASSEALELYLLLQAIAEPGRDELIRAALVSNLVAMNALELDTLVQDELQWEQVQLQFHQYHDDWLKHGFMSMFQRLLHDNEISHRLLSHMDGERRLTNLLQLAELIQAAGREHHGIENQLLWIQQQIAHPDGDADEQRLRLESDEGLVKVVNIHTSKGLEYPVVMLPFLWSSKSSKKDQAVYFHTLDDEAKSCLHLSPDDTTVAIAEQERLAEDTRLLYVALTRAKYLCYFACGNIRDMEKSALGWLLSEADKEPDVLLARIKQLVTTSAGNITLATANESASIAKTVIKPGILSSRLAQRHLHWRWRMTSYSGLTAGQEHVPHEFGSREEDSEAEMEHDAHTIFQFPKGARAGTFMHQIFEDIEFDSVTDKQLSIEVNDQLQRYGFEEHWRPVIEKMVRDVLTTPLDDAGLSLSLLTSDKRIAEMEFQYPIHNVQAAALNNIVAGLGEYTQHGPVLNFDPASGIMRGFVDLIFEHNNKYYIVDYKSNWLGTRVEDYQHDALQSVIASHRYDLQFLIYTLATHRYLSANLEDYDYHKHIGGVYYLFLRGMRRDSGNNGIYFAKPELELIEQLDAVMMGEVIS